MNSTIINIVTTTETHIRGEKKDPLSPKTKQHTDLNTQQSTIR